LLHNLRMTRLSCSLVAAIALLSAARPCAADGNEYHELTTRQSSEKLLLHRAPLTTLANLGEALFSDSRLSSDGTMSCSSCHKPGKYFADGLPTAKGIRGRTLTRNAPTLIGVGEESSYFWDGRARSLEAQIRQVVLNPAEFGAQSGTEITHRLRRNPRYVKAFSRLFPTERNPISLGTIAQAIAAYERTLVIGMSPFDRYFYAGNKRAISPSAIRGFKLFRGRANCASCHTVGQRPSPLSDEQFHRSALRLSPAVDRNLAQVARALVGARAAGHDISELISTDAGVASLGRFVVTLKPADIGRFKTPSLRNVAVTGPYMHDGSVASLREAVELELYTRRNAHHRPIVLSESDINDMVQFLQSLTSPLEKSTGP
jgi:cytochrome c peroxidase